MEFVSIGLYLSSFGALLLLAHIRSCLVGRADRLRGYKMAHAEATRKAAVRLALAA